MVLRDPVEWVCSLYDERREEFGERGWSMADVYLELGGGGSRSSELHARSGEFFNGQTRLALRRRDQEKLEYWAGIPERGAALRNAALEAFAGEEPIPVARGEALSLTAGSRGWPDPKTRSLILAHNQIDAELHAHFAGLVEREGQIRARGPKPRPRRRARVPSDGAVCVLGAPRSGTSLTARILNVLGVDLGPEDELMSAAAGNNHVGFWEHEGIADLNEDILATLGEAPRQRWRRPPHLPEGWERDRRLDSHRRAARSLLEQSFAYRPLWGWKDPRACLTLPFWQEVLTHAAGVETRLRYVICVRHPLDVAASLQARDEMSAEESHRLWLRYMSNAMAHTGGQPRLCISYESYFPEWETQAKRLAAFLGLPNPAEEQRQAIGAHVDEGLRHHRVANLGAGGDSELPTEVRELYVALSELARA
jgi:hypothetical protein